jgi:hypothetical protein
MMKERLAASTLERDRALQALTWDYPTDGARRAERRRVLREINGYHLTGDRRGSCSTLRRHEGRRVDQRRLLDLHRRLRRAGVNRRRQRGRRTRGARQRPSGAGPGRSTGASSTTAPPPTRTASRGASARRWSGGTRSSSAGRATTCPTSR